MEKKETPGYATGKDCPDCGLPESVRSFINREGGYSCRTVYSCEHYERRYNQCPFCGADDAPVRQVPLPIPFSDRYCDNCAEACYEEYASRPGVKALLEERAKRLAEMWGDYGPQRIAAKE